MASIDVREIKNLVQVGETTDQKGNPVAALEILGIPVLYSTQALDHYDTDTWQDIFETRLARLLAKALIKDDDPQWWSTQSPTGREVSRLSPEED